MRRVTRSWSSVCGCSNRSSPTAGRRQLPKSRHCDSSRFRRQRHESRTRKSRSTDCHRPGPITEADVPTSLLIFFTIVVALPVLGGFGVAIFQRWLQHKEKMSQLLAEQTAEKAAQYAAHVERIEARVRVLEQIATDRGVETAAQIEALRERPALNQPVPTHTSNAA